jgi:transcriptional regulator with XRE-family HTH domain
VDERNTQGAQFARKLRSRSCSFAPDHAKLLAMQPETGRLRVVVPDAPRQPPTDASTVDPAISVGSEGPLSPGAYIRDQRLKRQMTIEELAERTKIPPASLHALEQDQHDALPGAVFVKGFLRCCARALNVEPDRVVELLHEQQRAQLSARRRERKSNVPDAIPQMPALPRRGKALAKPISTAAWRVRDKLPSPTLLLWIAVVVFVAMVVLAALNLGPSGASPSV